VDGVDTIIFEISDVTSVDATAAEAMRQLIRTLSKKNIYVRLVRSVSLANDHYTRYELRRMMKHVGIYPTVQSAIDNVNRKKRKQITVLPVE
jgi:MFS superfamily sulfate permease-like transporter